MNKLVFWVGFLVLNVFHCSKADNTHCPDAGIKSNAAFKDLLAEGKPIRTQLQVGRGCVTDMMDKAERNGPYVKAGVNDNKVCYAVGDENSWVWVLSKGKEQPEAEDIQDATKDCANKKPYQTLYLPQEDNRNTYMILKPTKAALFFTTRLSGCDIFIAKNPSTPNQPMIIHANRNELKDNEKANIKQKGDDVDQLLNNIPGQPYALKYRFYHTLDTEAARKEMTDYQKIHSQVKLVEYNFSERNEFLYFVGYFENNQWKFFLKSDYNGTIIWGSCSEKQKQSSGPQCVIF